MRATEDDLDMIVSLAREAHVGSVWEDMGTTVDDASVRASVASLMARDDAAVFVSKRGVLMVCRVTLWFNHEQNTAHEIFYYATEGGDSLRREAEAWAGKGLVTLSRHDKTDARLEKLFTRAGYCAIEHTFIRRL